MPAERRSANISANQRLRLAPSRRPAFAGLRAMRGSPMLAGSGPDVALAGDDLARGRGGTERDRRTVGRVDALGPGAPRLLRQRDPGPGVHLRVDASEGLVGAHVDLDPPVVADVLRREVGAEGAPGVAEPREGLRRRDLAVAV